MVLASELVEAEVARVFVKMQVATETLATNLGQTVENYTAAVLEPFFAEITDEAVYPRELPGQINLFRRELGESWVEIAARADFTTLLREFIGTREQRRDVTISDRMKELFAGLLTDREIETWIAYRGWVKGK